MQEAIRQKASPLPHILAACAGHLKPDDMLMVASIIQNLSTEGDTMSQEDITSHLKNMRQAIDDLSGKMGGSR